MGATTVMEFTDRVFLGNYDLNSLAAATPAGITSFLFTAFFLGVAGYVTVFIAQYTGGLKGAGDSQYIMWPMVITGSLFLFLPVWAGITYWHLGLYFIWCCITIYLVGLFFLVMLRYRQGKWQTLSTIEKPLTPASPGIQTS